MKTVIKPGVYRHYKGRDYRVIGSARHSETEELLVVYHPLYGEEESREYWVRPLAMFEEIMTISGKTCRRFELVES
jgi:hypothetical protein